LYCVKRLLVGLAALAALGTAAPAQASTPMPWCGTDSSAVDRLPDATLGYAVHVAYVRAPGAPDRFGELAPRIVGDAAAIEAWWRSQDATRSLRFDLFQVGCASAFGALDITNVELPRPVGGIEGAFNQLRVLLSSVSGFKEVEKVYLVYYDGLTGQTGLDRVCGQGAPPGGLGLSGMAVVYLDSCFDASTGDSLRPIVGVHELVHVFGAVNDAAPHVCNDGHVCDVDTDLMAAFLSDEELEAHVLDGGHDDYYGHSGSWPDIQDSLFLERLDSPDRTAPTAPTALVAKDDPSGLVALSWGTSSDDVGPVAYRLYENGHFVREVAGSPALLNAPDGGTGSYSVRAADTVGHLSQLATIRFKLGLGIVDEQGRLLRDTVRPPAVRSVSVRRTAKTVVLSWPAVRDPGGLKGYRVKVGARTLSVTKASVTLTRATLRTAVSVAAVDKAGNVGPTTTVPLRRLR
jgi:hypothetical protein